MKDKIRLSIIIISYNTKELTHSCITQLLESIKKTSLHFEIIVVDNNSLDDSVDFLKAKWKNQPVIFIENKQNLGFGKANNIGIKKAQGTYILLLNSDVLINNVNWEEILSAMDKDPKIGVITVKVVLPNGNLDMASHRGFPTLWRSFTYFSKLETIFGHIPVLSHYFGGYHLLDKNLQTVHEIDSPTGAFYLTRKTILEKINGFDEDFFMYGEDLDLSFRIKNLGYSIIFYPSSKVTHIKNQSGIRTGNEAIETKTKGYFFESMKIFYDKHYAQRYPLWVNKLVHFFIKLKLKSA